MPYSKITVVVLNYNGFKHTSECLASLRKSSLNPLSVIVVDSASTDDSVMQLERILNPDELIKLASNGGYSYGNNIALAQAFSNGAEYVFIINNDTVLDHDCIADLINIVSKDTSIGIIGPKVLYYSEPDRINYAGMTGSIEYAKYRRVGLNETDTGQYTGLIETLYQDGCALLITKSCYKAIGGFDELLWAYSEDFDICVRARMAGFRVCCLQSAKIWHKVSASFGSYYERSPLAEYYSVRNNYIFHRRYAGAVHKRIMVILILLSRMPRRLLSIVFKSRKNRLVNLYTNIIATLVGMFTDKDKPRNTFCPN